MANSNFLKKLLTTASVIAVSASAGNALATQKQINGVATITNGGGVNIVDTQNPPVATNFNNGDNLRYLGNHTLTTGGIVNVGILDLNNNAAGLFTVANDVTIGSIINTGGAQKLSTLVNDGQTLTLSNNGNFTALGNIQIGSGAAGGTLTINAATELAGNITVNANNTSTINVDNNVVFAGSIGTAAARLGTLDIKNGRAATLKGETNSQLIQVGNGSTLSVANGVKVNSDNVRGAVADQGVLRFEGNLEFNVTKIGDVTKIKQIEVAGAGTADLKTTTNLNATTTLLNHNDAVLKFSAGNTAITDIKTGTANTGKVILANDVELQGQIGEAEKMVGEINFSTNKTLTLKKDDTKLYANSVTGAGVGKIDIQSANFEIHSNIGNPNAKLDSVKISSNAAGAAATTVKLMSGKAVYATNFDLSGAAFDNILELHDGSTITANVIASNANNGTISVKGDSIIDGKIGAAANLINKIRFDTAKQLTVTNNTILTNGGFEFNEDGILNLTEDSSVIFDKAIVVKTANDGAGSILFNGAQNGRVINLNAQIGDSAVADKALKLLEAKGGANISFGNNNIAIKKIDIGEKDSSLILNIANAAYLIGDFSHADAKGNVQIQNNITLKAGTKLSSSSTNTLKSIEFVGNKTLTVEDGVNLYTSAEANGGIRTNAQGNGKIVFAGDSIVSGVVGSNIAFGDIEVQGNDKTVTFKDDVKLSGAGAGNGIIEISKGAKVVLHGHFTGADIKGKNAGEGIVQFMNTESLTDNRKIQSKIGDGNKLDTVMLSGSDITFSDTVFDTDNLTFGGSASVSFENLGGNALQDTVITTDSVDRSNNINLLANKNYVFNKSVGTDDNQLGYVSLAKDKQITIGADFYADLRNVENQKVAAEFGGNGTSLGIGTEGSEFKLVTVAAKANRTFSGAIWSKDIVLTAGATTATFEKSIKGTNDLEMQAGTTANFTGENQSLNIKVTAQNAGDGTLNFSNSTSINTSIGTSADNVGTVNFTGAVDRVARLGSSIFANNINVGAHTVKIEADNVDLNGITVFTGSTIDLGTKSMTLKNGASAFAGSPTVNLVLSKGNDTGSIIVDGNGGGSFNVNGATELNINVLDNAANLPSSDQQYTLFQSINNGVITQIADGKTNVTVTGNNFVEWSLEGNNLVRKNVAKAKLSENLGANSPLLEDALRFVDSNNTGLAADYALELSRMSKPDLQESIARNSEVLAIQANEISSALMDSSNTVISSRIGVLSGHPQPGMQLSSSGTSGVSAGEGDDSKYGVWGSPIYNQATQKARGGRAGYKSSSYGLTIGADVEANADLSLGIAGTYSKSDVKFKDHKSGDKLKADSFMLSVYGIQQLTDNWFLQGHAAYQTSRMKNTEKRVTATVAQTAKASYDVTSYNTEILAGYNCNYADTIVTPLIGASYTRTNSSGYTETGTTNQNQTVKTKATNKLEAVAGLRAQMTTDMNGISLTPDIHGYLRHDLVGKDGATTSRLSGAANSIVPKTSKPSRTTFNVGLGINAVSGMYEYGAGYDLFVANKLTGHQGTLKVRVNF